MNEKTIEVWDIDRLKRNPHQDKLVRDMNPALIDALVADLRGFGLDEPIEVLPDGTILNGHQRWEAAKKIPWDKFTVWVRHDLAGDPLAGERRIVKTNSLQKEIDTLDRVRLARRKLEMEKGRAPGKLDEQEKGDLRDRVGKLAGMTGRNAHRYTPISAGEID